MWKQSILTIGPLGKSDGLNSLVILHFLHLFNKYLLKSLMFVNKIDMVHALMEYIMVQ